MPLVIESKSLAYELLYWVLESSLVEKVADEDDDRILRISVGTSHSAPLSMCCLLEGDAPLEDSPTRMLLSVIVALGYFD